MLLQVLVLVGILYNFHKTRQLVRLLSGEAREKELERYKTLSLLLTVTAVATLPITPIVTFSGLFSMLIVMGIVLITLLTYNTKWWYNAS